MKGRSQFEFTDYITPDGEVYNFEGHDRFLFTEVGYGMPPIEYITQKSPNQHGETVLNYRLQPRTIQLLYRSQGCSRDEYWSDRHMLLNMLRPNRQLTGYLTPGVLRKTLPDGTKRAINVFIDQGPVFEARSMDQWDEWSFTETLRFIAHDPIFYNPDAVCYTWTIDTLHNHLVFEHDGANTEDLIFHLNGVGTGLIFGTNGISVSLSLTYTGSWPAYPIFELDGPLSGFTVYNITTDETLKYARDVLLGETVTISLAPSFKSVTSSVYGNMMSAMTPDSDIATFHIATAPEATGGVNQILVGATGADIVGNTAIRMSFYTRYIGI